LGRGGKGFASLYTIVAGAGNTAKFAVFLTLNGKPAAESAKLQMAFGFLMPQVTKMVDALLEKHTAHEAQAFFPGGNWLADSQFFFRNINYVEQREQNYWQLTGDAVEGRFGAAEEKLREDLYAFLKSLKTGIIEEGIGGHVNGISSKIDPQQVYIAHSQMAQQRWLCTLDRA